MMYSLLGIENRRVSSFFWLHECRKFLTLTAIEENAAHVYGLLQNLLFGYHSADRSLHGTRLRMWFTDQYSLDLAWIHTRIDSRAIHHRKVLGDVQVNAHTAAMTTQMDKLHELKYPIALPVCYVAKILPLHIRWIFCVAFRFDDTVSVTLIGLLCSISSAIHTVGPMGFS